MVIRIDYRLVIFNMAISARSASGAREGDQKEKADDDRMVLKIAQVLLL